MIVLGTLLTAFARAQVDLPPPPPPIGPAPNAPQPAMPPVLPPVLPPQANPVPDAQPPQIGALSTLIAVDAAAKRRDISPLIYGVAFATKLQLQALNAPLISQQAGPGLADFRTVQPKSLRRVFSDDASPNTQALRNRATRLLWDPRYGSPAGGVRSASTALIPQLKSRLKSYPAGTKAGLVNYSWGAENSMGGATAQADVLGIFGREGLDLAARAAPDTAAPTFKAMQMYRNYDGKNSAFGDISVSDIVPNPDTLSSFASVRRSDGALTVMVINKSLTVLAPVELSVGHFAGTMVNVWQLTSANTIIHLPDAALSVGVLSATLPTQSITLFVVTAR